MGRVLDEQERKALQEGINSTSEELSSTIGALQRLMDESLDWRAWVRRHPWPMLGAAAVIGLRIGRGRWI
jgi:ElaB/YqjD/DUF883 family membrane-anchored ribosome-binding protein